MDDFLLAVSAFLLLNILAGMIRLLRGPEDTDRMLAVQLFGTTGVGILLLLGAALDSPALTDIALIFVLLATLAILTFKKRVMKRSMYERGDS